MGTRFQAEHTLVGNIEQICRDLASRVQLLQSKVDKKRRIQQSMKIEEEAMIEKFSYMMHNNPEVCEVEGPEKKQLSLRRIVSDGLASVIKDAETLWKAIHNGEVSSFV